tara:strand:+ start:2309 stop:2809 length:501 start_codon:yes stop_codon:yes gene_type:complete
MIIDGGKHGHFVNANEGEGWEIRHSGTRRLLFPHSLYDFNLKYPHPLTWYDKKERLYYQPDRKFSTDLGSTPFFTWQFLPKDQFPRSYCFHDSAWIHGGLYIADELDGEFRWRKVSKWHSNRLLWRWTYAEGARMRNPFIFAGVTLGASYSGVKGSICRLFRRNRG